jgi:ABC-type polysaccharide/polyol phosphate transport system ATPase subunit
MNPQNDIAIQLTGVTKEYIIHHEKPTLVEKFTTGREERFIAINNINLTVKKGEKIGLFGPNGCGKTTILKIITGITTPTSGKIYVRGKITSLIDVESGFHPDLSGYQNIYLNGMLLGMTKKEINNNINSIIQFADIKQFIDASLYTYSQGMKLRLGFSVALFSNPAILIIDEAIGAGDTDFRTKLQRAVNNIVKNKKVTVVIAMQFYDYLQRFTNKILTLNNGVIVKEEYNEIRG